MIKVLIVDDSAFMREALAQIIKADGALEVVGIATDGEEAVGKALSLNPDVILLDIQMPRMDGLAALAHIMAARPMPVVMISGANQHDAGLIIKSLEYGAVDFITKPSGVISYDIDRIGNEIINKLKAAACVTVKNKPLAFLPYFAPFAPSIIPAEQQLVVMGASTGGISALITVLAGLQGNIPAAFLVVQHLEAWCTAAFVDRLKWSTLLEVSVAAQDESPRNGHVLVAPGGFHVAVDSSNGKKRLDISEKASADLISPSINIAMDSAAKVYGAGVIGVILTGVGDDGLQGMKAIKKAGGRTIAEDSSTCVVYGMSKAAIEAGYVDKVAPLPMIAATILGMIYGGEYEFRSDLAAFLPEYFRDAKEGVDKFKIAILALKKDAAAREPFLQIRMGLHHLKSSSETIGFEDIAYLSGLGLTLLGKTGEQGNIPQPEAVGILSEIADTLDTMVAERQDGINTGWFGRIGKLRREAAAVKSGK